MSKNTKHNHELVKLFKYSSLPEKVAEYFNNHFAFQDELFIFKTDYLKFKNLKKYSGGLIICKYKNLVIEKGDNLLLDWLLNNGFDMAKEEFVLIVNK